MSSGFSGKALLVLSALLLAAPAGARAQYFAFGKNKVQYERHDWRYVQSKHFDVYFYTHPEGSGEALAAYTARAAEEAYVQITDLFGHEIKGRVPIIAYQGHSDFAVTNAVDLPIYAEGIGGVTELFKNRIVVPFTGDYEDYRRVVHHELAHAALNDLFYGGSVQSILRSGADLRLPLWFTEGLAEYAAQGWDAEADMRVREAVTQDRLSSIAELSGYAAYWGGQGVWDYVAAQYGRPKIAEILSRLRATRSVEESFHEATGLSLEALSDRWQQALREVHFPEVAGREALGEVAAPLAMRREGRYHGSPALSPQGTRVAYVTAKGPLFAVYVADTEGKRPPQKLIGGQAGAAFEGLRPQAPGLSWSPDGRQLAVAVKSGASDALLLVNVQTRETERYRVPGLDQIGGVAWSPDGSRIAFAATAGAQSDIYTLDLKTRRTANHTRDVFSDHEPAWRPDGRALVFHSDRGDRTELGRYAAGQAAPPARPADVFLLRLGAPEAVRLTRSGGWQNRSAHLGRDPGRLLFISDRNGIPNLYEKNLKTSTERALTNVTHGITQVALDADGQRAAVVGLQNGAPSIYRLDAPFARRPLEPPQLAPTVWAQRAWAPPGPPVPALTLASAERTQRNPFLRAAAQSGGLPPSFLRALVTARGAFGPGGAVQNEEPPEAQPARAASSRAAPDTAAYGGVRVAFGAEQQQAARAQQTSASPETVEAAEAAVPDDLTPKRYKLLFSPDLIYGATGYDALYGVQGVAQMQFSDLLGGHQLRFTTNLLVDLRNADYALSYSYLPRRTDYAVSAYHTARLLPDYEVHTYYRYRRYGLSLRASYPLDRYRRVDLDAGVVGVNQADIANPAAPPLTRVLFNPAVTFTRDVTMPGRFGPSGGHRVAVSLSGGIGSIQFATLLADARAYTSLFGARGLTLGLRASAGTSAGGTPQLFYAAGVQNWLNRDFDDASGFPIDDPADFVFATPVLPLRGHPLNARGGAHFGLINAAVRFPLGVNRLPVPLLPLRPLHGTAFADAGAVWGREGSHSGFRAMSTSIAGERVFDDLLVGAGVGLRTLVLGYPVRLDVAWPFDGQRFGRRTLYLSVGYDF